MTFIQTLSPPDFISLLAQKYLSSSLLDCTEPPQLLIPGSIPLSQLLRLALSRSSASFSPYNAGNSKGSATCTASKGYTTLSAYGSTLFLYDDNGLDLDHILKILQRNGIISLDDPVVLTTHHQNQPPVLIDSAESFSERELGAFDKEGLGAFDKEFEQREVVFGRDSPFKFSKLAKKNELEAQIISSDTLFSTTTLQKTVLLKGSTESIKIPTRIISTEIQEQHLKFKETLQFQSQLLLKQSQLDSTPQPRKGKVVTHLYWVQGGLAALLAQFPVLDKRVEFVAPLQVLETDAFNPLDTHNQTMDLDVTSIDLNFNEEEITGITTELNGGVEPPETITRIQGEDGVVRGLDGEILEEISQKKKSLGAYEQRLLSNGVYGLKGRTPMTSLRKLQASLVSSVWFGGEIQEPTMILPFMYLSSAHKSSMTFDNVIRLGWGFEPIAGRVSEFRVSDSIGEPLEEVLERTTELIREAKLRGETVLIHCHAGVSRSSTVVLAYLIAYEGFDLKRAFNYVFMRRPIIRPNWGFARCLGDDLEARWMSESYAVWIEYLEFMHRWASIDFKEKSSKPV